MTPRHTKISQLPVVDLTNWTHGTMESRLGLARSVRDICHEIGFFYITNHGVAPTLCQKYMAVLKQFFNLPEKEKLVIEKTKSPQFRGWEKLGSELTNNEVDLREQLDVGTDRKAIRNPDPFYMHLVGPNQWPNEELLPEFKNIVSQYMDQVALLSLQLLRMISISLGMPEANIENRFRGTPASYLKLIRYPTTTEGSRGVGQHKDSGFITLLLQDTIPGLEARTSSGEWLSIPPIPHTIVVNIGELLQMMTHNYLVATPHRVINASHQTRYSSAFFYCPDLNSRLDPLPIDSVYIKKAQSSEYHRSAGFMASRSEMMQGTAGMESDTKPDIFGYKHWERWVRSYPDIAEHYYPDLVSG